MEVRSDYVPHPKQEIFHQTWANEVLFGGAAGPGKSRALREELVRLCISTSGLQAFLFRRTYPELERNHILPFRMDIPNAIYDWNETKHRATFINASCLHFASCQYEKDVFDFQGAEIHVLAIDELTAFTEFMYDYLRARVRCVLPYIPESLKNNIPGIYCASNPGGVGHQFCKERWVDFAGPYEIKQAPDDQGSMNRQYIPATLEDNPTLTTLDPGYASRLDALPEPYRTAYRKGDWNIFLGQAFSITDRHEIDPVPVPETAPLLWTFDWGSGAPWCAQWFWIDDDNRLYMFWEYYGALAPPAPANQGLRLTDEEIANIIIREEARMGISHRKILRLSDPTCFNKRPDNRGGGQTQSTAEVFANMGIVMKPGDPSRSLKIRQVRSRLKIPEDPNEMPMLVLYRGCCPNFIRTMRALQTDPRNVEDVDTRMEDHPYDTVALACQARPMSIRAAAMMDDPVEMGAIG